MDHDNYPVADNDNAPAIVGNSGPRALDLFSAAAGGWSLGMHRAGYHTIAACEVIDWRRALYSQNNPGVPVYDDVTTLTADRLIRDGVGLPDIIVGSPPCQDISSANTKGKGVDGERSGLYFEAVRIIDECRPDWFALENSANLRTRGADRVITSLEGIGYTCWPFVVSASDVGANHERKRSWLIGFNARDAEKVGWRAWWSRRRAFAIAGLSVETCGDADTAGERHESGRTWRHGQDGDGSPSIAPSDTANSGSQGCGTGQSGVECMEASKGQTTWRAHASSDARIGDGDAGREFSEMGGCTPAGATAPEPWADWNGGLAGHLRMDDGLSAYVAESRIAVGGKRGTVAASLIVEAFGDAVCPQIPEAIGRAISRVEVAMAAIHTTNQERALAA